jgi:hypothetical protein
LARWGWTGKIGGFSNIVLYSTGRPNHVSSAQDMEMKVKHGLATIRTGVDHEAISGISNSLQFRNFVPGEHQTSDQPYVQIF